MESTRIIDAGAAFATTPVEGAPCTFRTTTRCVLHPLRLVDATRVPESDTTLRLVFQRHAGARLIAAPGEALRVFFSGELEAALALRSFVLRHVVGVTARSLDGRSASVSLAEPEGFGGPSRPITPVVPLLRPVPAGGAAPDGVFAAFDGLRDALAFPAAFAFADIVGIGKVDRLLEQHGGFALDLVLDEALPRGMLFDVDHLHIGCVPAVNVFPAGPVTVPAVAAPERSIVSLAGVAAAEVYAIESVHLGRPQEASRPSIAPLSAFGAGQALDAEGESAFERGALRLSYEVHRPLSSQGAHADVAVSLTSIDGPPILEDDDVLRIGVLATNGARAARLGIGDVGIETASSPDFVAARNVVAPTAPMPSSFGAGTRLFDVLSLANGNLWDATRPEALARLLALANDPAVVGWPTAKAGAEAFEGLLAVGLRRGDDVEGEVARSGVEVILTFAAKAFRGDGELHLLGERLGDLFAALVPTLEWVRVEVRADDGRVVYASPLLTGTRLVL